MLEFFQENIRRDPPVDRFLHARQHPYLADNGKIDGHRHSSLSHRNEGTDGWILRSTGTCVTSLALARQRLSIARTHGTVTKTYLSCRDELKRVAGEDVPDAFENLLGPCGVAKASETHAGRGTEKDR